MIGTGVTRMCVEENSSRAYDWKTTAETDGGAAVLSEMF